MALFRRPNAARFTAALTREALAILCLVIGVGAAVTGAAVLWGVGWALLVLAVALLSVALLLGWE